VRRFNLESLQYLRRLRTELRNDARVRALRKKPV
jgi:hypothetical protein